MFSLIVCCCLLTFGVYAINQCQVDKIFIPTSPVSRVIFKYECLTGTDANPTIPSDTGSSQSEFNELDLSPNLYDQMPYSQICVFSNIYLLDLSHNSIGNISSAFSILACLTNLKQIDLSNNLITTTLTANDFNDVLAFQLQKINLNNNLLTSIDSSTFYRANGQTRFPNLNYLGLANNLLFSLDLLWPMTIPNPNLRVDLDNNLISSFTNPLNKYYGDNIFIPMAGYRYVDLRNNSITSLDDSSLLQYGLYTADDFKNLLLKMSNYDLRGESLRCTCPPSGLYTVHWFGQFINSALNPSALIYQLNCANIASNPFIFNFTCNFVGTDVRTTTTTTTTTTAKTITTTTATTTKVSTVTSSSNNGQSTTAQTGTTGTGTSISSSITSTTTVGVNSAGQQVADNSTVSATSLTSNNSNLFLLFLLFIPLFLILLALFACLCGRCCLRCCYNNFSIMCCHCLRPESNKTPVKKYDSTVCYNQLDEGWVEENIMPSLVEKLPKRAKVNKINRVTGDENENDTLRSSKRVIIIMTKKFYNDEWQNAAFRENLNKICRKELNTSIIIVNVSDLSDKELHDLRNQIELGSDELSNVRLKLANQIRYNCSLRDVEIIDWNETNFWGKMNYLLPYKSASNGPIGGVKETPKYKKIENREVVPKIHPNVAVEVKNPVEAAPESGRKESVMVENEFNLITKLRKSIDAKRVTPVQKDDVISVKDDQFWNSLILTKSEYNFEPIGYAGSSVSGNRESNLNRFGVPVTNRESVNLSRQSQLSIPNKTNSVEPLRMDGPPSGRLYIPPDLLSKSLKSELSMKLDQQLNIEPVTDSNVQSRKPDYDDDDLIQSDEHSINKPKKVQALPPSPSPRRLGKASSTLNLTKKEQPVDKKQPQQQEQQQRPRSKSSTETTRMTKSSLSTSGPDTNDPFQNDSDDVLIKKPKKKVIISTDLNTEKKFSVSTTYSSSEADEQKDDLDDILRELDANINDVAANPKKKKKSKRSSNESQNNKKKDFSDDLDYNFEID